MNLNHDEIDFTKVSEVKISDTFFDRLKTNIKQLDQMFSEQGGIVRGSTMTLIANAGVGKTTFTMMLAEYLVKAGYRVGYATGEESHEQLAYTSKRLGADNVEISTMTDCDELCQAMNNFDLMIVDSFQSVKTNQKLSKIAKSDYIINNLTSSAKKTKCALIIICHVTSDGKIKGGPNLLHTVDINIQINKLIKNPNCRIISFYKNRYGPTNNYNLSFNEHGYIFDQNSKSLNDIIMNFDEFLYFNLDKLMTYLKNESSALDIEEKDVKIALKCLEKNKKLSKLGFGKWSYWTSRNIEIIEFIKILAINKLIEFFAKKLNVKDYGKWINIKS